MLKASCHCGAVSINVMRKPRTLTECNCSICRRYGAAWAYYSRKTAQLMSSPDVVSGYTWGSRRLEFYHCKSCGCLTHYESVEKKEDSRVAVNARMFEPSQIAAVRRRKFDGAKSWKFVDDWP